MRAILTQEQEMLRSTAARIAHAAAVSTPSDLENQNQNAAWSTLVQAGLLGMRGRDETGAPLTSAVEVMLVARSLAETLAQIPFLGTTLVVDLLARAGGAEPLIDEIVTGNVRYSVLLSTELDGLAEVGATEKAICVDGGDALYGLALSRAEGGWHAVRVALDDARARVGVDLTRPIGSAVIAAAEPVGGPLSNDDIQCWTALALTLTCADIVGVLHTGLLNLVEYTKTRIQYAVPIGSFQAVQHMCAEMLVEIEAAASLTNYAAWAVDALDTEAAILAARTAKAYCAQAAQDVGEKLMQAYGGIGQTWEHEAHLRMRRAMFDRELFGGEARQLLAIADLRMGRH